jgi:hypothetical protein
MPGSWNPADFPGLTDTDYIETSKATRRYNCIAWAFKDTSAWWWPDKLGIGKWPLYIPREATVDAFVRAFATEGYVRCDNRLMEEGFEKIVLYGKVDVLTGNSLPTHAAIQLPNGHWSSKLGTFEDIEHPLAESLEGPSYGSLLTVYLKRPRRP